MSVMVHDKGLSTDIGWGGRDINGNNVPTKNRAQVYRMLVMMEEPLLK